MDFFEWEKFDKYYQYKESCNQLVAVLKSWVALQHWDPEYRKKLRKLVIRTDRVVSGAPRIYNVRITVEQVASYMVGAWLQNNDAHEDQGLDLTIEQMDAAALYVTTFPVSQWVANYQFGRSPTRPNAEMDVHMTEQEEELPTKVLTGLYLGSEWTAISIEQLAEFNITHIINAGWPRIREHYPSQICYHNLEFDENSPNFLIDLDECYRFIDTNRNQGRTVLVFCKSGATKSATIIIGYLMGLNKWPLTQAYAFLKRRHPTIKLTDQILNNLLAFESHILGQSISDQPQEKFSTPSQEVPSLVSTILTENYDDLFSKCQQMLISQSSADLKKLYDTLPNNEEIGDILRRSIYLHVKQQAKSFAEQNFENQEFVVQVVNFVSQLTSLLSSSFPNENAGLSRSMHLALPFLVKETPEKYQKIFASAINQRKLKESEIEIVLLLVSCLNEKSAFENLYINGASIRLLNGTSTVEEELAVAEKLKKFPQLTSVAGNVFKMLEDFQVALEASNMFKEGNPNKMNVSVFCGAKWPVSTFMAKHKREKTEGYLGAKIEHLPAKPHLSWDSEVLWENFSQFYKKNFPGKNLHLASQWGTAEIEFVANNRKYFLTVSTFMMCVLELFNFADSMNFEDIQKNTLIETQYLKQALYSLVHYKVLLNQNEVYSVNHNFVAKTTKLKINTLLLP